MSLAAVLKGWMPGSPRHEAVAAPARVHAFDPALLWVTVALLAWGLVMVYSASIALPDNPRFGRYAPSRPSPPSGEGVRSGCRKAALIASRTVSRSSNTDRVVKRTTL